MSKGKFCKRAFFDKYTIDSHFNSHIQFCFSVRCNLIVQFSPFKCVHLEVSILLHLLIPESAQTGWLFLDVSAFALCIEQSETSSHIH